MHVTDWSTGRTKHGQATDNKVISPSSCIDSPRIDTPLFTLVSTNALLFSSKVIRFAGFPVPMLQSSLTAKQTSPPCGHLDFLNGSSCVAHLPIFPVFRRDPSTIIRHLCPLIRHDCPNQRGCATSLPTYLVPSPVRIRLPVSRNLPLVLFIFRPCV